jgi:tyrosyl-tRNA synthetase
MNAMVPGLAGGKMSSSDPNSKIDLLDGPDAVKRKIKAAFCEEGTVEGNGVLAFVEAVVIPISQLRNQQRIDGTNKQPNPFLEPNAPEGTVFTIPRDEKFGGPSHYSSYEQLRADFEAKVVHPKDLKQAVGAAIDALLAPVRAAFAADEEWQRIEKLAYPDPNAKPEKTKKKKVRGARIRGMPLVSCCCVC